MDGVSVAEQYAHAMRALIGAVTDQPVFVDEIGRDLIDADYPYHMLFTSPARLGSSTLGQVSQEFRTVIHLMAVGRDQTETLAHHELGIGALADQRVAVAGRRRVKLRQEDLLAPVLAPPGERSPITGRPVFSVTSMWPIFSTPTRT